MDGERERHVNSGLGDMEIRQLKLATRKLLDSFGSLEKAAAHCRVKPSNLSQYQSFEHTAFMPVDVALALEKIAGEPVVTRELARIHGSEACGEADRDVLDEALDVPVAVGELLAYVREAKAPHSPAGRRMSENEKRLYFELRARVSEELRQLDEAVEQDGVLRLSRAASDVA